MSREKFDAAVEERALRMFAEHRRGYPLDTVLAEALARSSQS